MPPSPHPASTRPLLFALALVAASLAGAPPTHAQTAPAARAAARPPARPADTTGAGSVVAAVRALFAASERNDLDALGRLYDADVTVVEGAGLDRRWVEYRDHHLAPELREFEDFRYRPFEIEAQVLGPNAAYATFRYALRATTPERPVDIVGRGTFVLRRVAGGAWRVVHSQTSGRARRDADPAFPR